MTTRRRFILLGSGGMAAALFLPGLPLTASAATSPRFLTSASFGPKKNLVQRVQWSLPIEVRPNSRCRVELAFDARLFESSDVVVVQLDTGPVPIALSRRTAKGSRATVGFEFDTKESKTAIVVLPLHAGTGDFAATFVQPYPVEMKTWQGVVPLASDRISNVVTTEPAEPLSLSVAWVDLQDSPAEVSGIYSIPKLILLENQASKATGSASSGALVLGADSAVVDGFTVSLDEGHSALSQAPVLTQSGRTTGRLLVHELSDIVVQPGDVLALQVIASSGTGARLGKSKPGHAWCSYNSTGGGTPSYTQRPQVSDRTVSGLGQKLDGESSMMGG